MKPFESDNAEHPPAAKNACAGCALNDSRREFLRDAAAALAGIAAVLGLPASAPAFPLRLAAASRVRGAEVSYPVPQVDGVTMDKEREVILVRWDGAVYAFRLSCPHQKTALKWKEKDGRFQCPKHKSKYQPDGKFIEGRATRGMDRYAVRRKKGEIVVDLSKVYLEDKDQAGWRAAAVKL
jgi:nitrite reductase/ring-hydroxylating ferredoxin subunit